MCDVGLIYKIRGECTATVSFGLTDWARMKILSSLQVLYKIYSSKGELSSQQTKAKCLKYDIFLFWYQTFLKVYEVLHLKRLSNIYLTEVSKKKKQINFFPVCIDLTQHYFLNKPKPLEGIEPATLFPID